MLQRPVGALNDLAGVIKQVVAQHPGGKYIEISHSGERLSATFEELHHRALRILDELNLRTNAGRSEVVLCFESLLDFVPAAWACIFGNYSCLPWQIHKTGTARKDIAAKLKIIAGKLDQPVLVTTEKLKIRVGVSSGTPFKSTVYVDQLQSDDVGINLNCVTVAGAGNSSSKDAALLIWTSGTTGDPKIAAVDYQTILNRFWAYKPVNAGHKTVLQFPFDSITSFGVICPNIPKVVFLQPERFAAQPLDLLAVIEDFRIEAFALSSSLASRISESLSKSPREFNLSSLQHVGFGAEMIAAGTVSALVAQFRDMGADDLRISLGYGMTETALICWTGQITFSQAIARLEQNHGPLSVGACTAGGSLRIVDDHGKPAPGGQVGDIEVWTPDKMFSGYLGDPQASAECFTDDGWFKTGDRGAIVDGELIITGRQKSTIIVNGRNISLEQIESPLRQLKEIRQSMVAAVPLRLQESVTDELAVFFVPHSQDENAISALCRNIVRTTAREVGVTVKRLIPLKAAEFARTPTGKVKHQALADGYNRGLWPHYALERSGLPDQDHGAVDTEAWLSELWQKVLKLDSGTGRDENFFDLGGDSLASAELISAIEEHFSCDIPIETFFAHPTVSTLVDLLAQDAADLPNNQADQSGHEQGLLHDLHSYVGSWEGERLAPDSLVVGLNTAGSSIPIFWVFQGQNELSQLARHLGSDQPIYGMRSLHQIRKICDYSTSVLDTVCSRYLREVRAISANGPIIVGGNCQGGIIALELARRLGQIGRKPRILVLMEWSYSCGHYEDATLFLYGDKSHTAGIFKQPQGSGPDWRADFPMCTVAPIQGAHGSFFSNRNVGSLAGQLSEIAGTERSPKTGLP